MDTDARFTHTDFQTGFVVVESFSSTLDPVCYERNICLKTILHFIISQHLIISRKFKPHAINEII